METTRIIARINNVDIMTTSEEQLIPIKPICEALGVNYTTQIEKLKKHPVYGSFIPLKGIVAADGKIREMSCMPLRLVSGWIFSIHPDNVKEEVRERLIEYQMKCNDALYDYFFGNFKRVNEQNQVEIALLEQLTEYTQQREAASNGIRDTRRKLEQIRKERLNDTPQLFD